MSNITPIAGGHPYATASAICTSRVSSGPQGQDVVDNAHAATDDASRSFRTFTSTPAPLR